MTPALWLGVALLVLLALALLGRLVAWLRARRLERERFHEALRALPHVERARHELVLLDGRAEEVESETEKARAIADDARQLAARTAEDVDELRERVRSVQLAELQRPKAAPEPHLCAPCSYCGKSLRAHLS